jgi:hypothetical protein
VEKYGRARQAKDDNIIRRMRTAYCITKATDTHSECVMLIALPLQQWLLERASMLRLYVQGLPSYFTNIAYELNYARASSHFDHPVHHKIQRQKWNVIQHPSTRLFSVLAAKTFKNIGPHVISHKLLNQLFYKISYLVTLSKMC